MFEVIKCYYDDLTDNEREGVSDNGFGKEEANYLKLVYNGKTVGIFSDAMEPEDATFNRDLSWIREALLAAYRAGQRGIIKDEGN